MRVKMKVGIAGTRNGEEWPPLGGGIDLPDDEATHLRKVGMAEVDEEWLAEQAAEAERLAAEQAEAEQKAERLAAEKAAAAVKPQLDDSPPETAAAKPAPRTATTRRK